MQAKTELRDLLFGGCFPPSLSEVEKFHFHSLASCWLRQVKKCSKFCFAIVFPTVFWPPWKNENRDTLPRKTRDWKISYHYGTGQIYLMLLLSGTGLARYCCSFESRMRFSAKECSQVSNIFEAIFAKFVLNTKMLLSQSDMEMISSHR